jgi:predicted glycoside hydrolase/deacetylase ChbG (UPF0249 family)
LRAKKPNVTITADDAGVEGSIDIAIAALAEKGRLQSVAICVTYPDELPYTKKLLGDLPIALGIHINLSSGAPINKPSSIPSLMKGNLFKSPTGLAASLGGDFKEALMQFREELGSEIKPKEISREVAAQTQRFEAEFKRYPAFLSVHHDLDLVPVVNGAIATAAPRLPSRQSRLQARNLTHYVCTFAQDDDIVKWQANLRRQLQVAAETPSSTHLFVTHPALTPPSSEFTVYRTGRVIEYEALKSMSTSDFPDSLRLVAEGGDQM